MGRGFLIILSAPSGAGKSTLAGYLTEQVGVEASISTTTRPPRPGEEDGRHYHFVDRELFAARVKTGAFLEHAEVFGNFYGTAKASVESALAAGKCLLLTIDWQGAALVRQAMDPADVVSIFLMPPDRATLQVRLDGRGQDAAEVIARRMSQAQTEMAHWHEYDYVVINDDLARAQEELRAIVMAERLRRHRLDSRGLAVLRGLGLA